MSRTIRIASILCVVIVAIACGGGGGTSKTRSGVTSCGESVSCQAGQYCSDPRFAQCDNGCLSNTNCAADQTCVAVEGSSVGTCSLTDTPTVDMQPPSQPTPDMTAPPVNTNGCGDGVCKDSELDTCAVDCQDLTSSALDICDAYDFFMCFEPGDLQACYDLVDAATVAQRQQFVTCGATGTVSCESCFQYLPE